VDKVVIAGARRWSIAEAYGGTERADAAMLSKIIASRFAYSGR